MSQPRSSRIGSRISRRDFLKNAALVSSVGLMASAGGSLLSGCAPVPAASAPAKISVQFSWLKTVEFIGFYAADVKGYYKEENLEVDLAGGGPTVAAGQLVDSRQKDVGIQLAALDLVKSNAQGAKLVTFANLFQRSPAGLMYVTKKPDGTAGTIIDTPQAAKGKRIGLQPGAMLAWRVICQQNGMDMDKDMQIVNVSFDPAPLADGTVDGYWCFATSQPYTLQTRGYEVGILDAYAAGYTPYGGFFTTHQDYLKNNKDVLVRFVRATAKGWAYAYKNLEEMVKYTVDTFGADLKLDLAQQLWEAKAQEPFLHSDLTKDKGLLWCENKGWEDTVAMMLAQKELEKTLDVKTFVNTDVLTEAYKGGKANLGQ